MEDAGVARHLRDAQVFPIWEGAPNVLALDMLRAMGGANGLEPLYRRHAAELSRADAARLRDSCDALARHVEALRASSEALLAADAETQQASARDLALHLGALYPAVLALSSRKRRPAPWRPFRARSRRAFRPGVSRACATSRPRCSREQWRDG